MKFTEEAWEQIWIIIALLPRADIGALVTHEHIMAGEVRSIHIQVTPSSNFWLTLAQQFSFSRSQQILSRLFDRERMRYYDIMPVILIFLELKFLNTWI